MKASRHDPAIASMHTSRLADIALDNGSDLYQSDKQLGSAMRSAMEAAGTSWRRCGLELDSRVNLLAQRCDTVTANQINRARLAFRQGAAMRIAIIALCLGLSTGRLRPDHAAADQGFAEYHRTNRDPGEKGSSAARYQIGRGAGFQSAGGNTSRDAVGSRRLVQANEIAARLGLRVALRAQPVDAAAARSQSSTSALLVIPLMMRSSSPGYSAMICQSSSAMRFILKFTRGFFIPPYAGWLAQKQSKWIGILSACSALCSALQTVGLRA